MNTKKFFRVALTAMCAIAMTTVFTSCSKDDDDSITTGNNKPVAAVMEYSLTVGDDMFNYLDLTVEYYGADGKIQTEQMTQKSWSKNVKAKLPATLGACMKIHLKSGIDLANLAKFTEDIKYTYSVAPVNASGIELSGGKAYSSHPTLDMPGDKVVDWVAKHADGLVKFLYVIDGYGQVSDGSWK